MRKVNYDKFPSTKISGTILRGDVYKRQAPWCRVKERHYAKRSLNCFFYSFKESLPINHSRIVCNVRIQPEIGFIKQSFLILIKNSPIIKIPSLIL